MQDVFKNLRRVFDAVGRKVTPYEPNKELVPGITSVATPGHTPGHNSHVIASGSSKVYVQGDVTHVPFLFVRHPDWHAFYDQDGKMAEETRRKVYDMLVAEKMMVQGSTIRSRHWPMSKERIGLSGNSCALEPDDLAADVEDFEQPFTGS